jgi:hypothetical protein
MKRTHTYICKFIYNIKTKFTHPSKLAFPGIEDNPRPAAPVVSPEFAYK